ncbi:pentapeptide repeat-containing protein [Streptomyces anulatus]
MGLHGCFLPDVRCGAVLCGAVLCGAVLCGAVLCGAVLCGAVLCGAPKTCGAGRHVAPAQTSAVSFLTPGSHPRRPSRPSRPPRHGRVTAADAPAWARHRRFPSLPLLVRPPILPERHGALP